MKSKAVPQVMGILNVTPDSFFDGGHYQNVENAIAHGLQMVEEGADIIDIGGESTRPGANPLPILEECERVLPVIEALRKETSIPISIDTRHAQVMQAALNAGANIVNDINALRDPGAIEIVAYQQAIACLMHMQGTPEKMQESPKYNDVAQEIYDFLAERILVCEQNGILRKNIWIDPGFGFGKLLPHNLKLLGELSFFQSLGCPIVIGLSRKSFLGEILNMPVEQRLYGSLAGTVIALLQGAAIIRTHDVAATKQVLAVVSAVEPYMQDPRRFEFNVCGA